MALKSYRLKLKKGKETKKPIGKLLVGGATALIGLALFSETAKAVRNI